MDSSPVKVVPVGGVSNREFLERYAKAGRVGLCGGDTLIDLAIRRAERHLDDDAQWSRWSHAFIFQGERADGRHWVVESDLQVHHKHIQLGVQENRIDKFFDEKACPHLAILDFNLEAARTAALLSEALDLVANRERYSVREIFGTLLGLRRPELREQENVFARERSVFCSAFVRRIYHSAGVDLVPGIASKHTTPEDIARTALPHVKYILERERAPGKFARLRANLHQRVKAPMVRLRKKRGGG